MYWTVLLMALEVGTNDPLTAVEWNHRVLIVAGVDRQAALQKKLILEDRAGFEERDLLLVEVRFDSDSWSIDGRPRAAGAESLRRRRKLEPPFTVVLVGKDGDTKLSSRKPVGVQTLWDRIDAMPMRRREMHERRTE